ncbi:MAG: LamB/YcsF family protein [Verrucomicrobia bacterium]|nr:LamB/YcsF family protein [Verrucomicrobiota bacterium]
MKLDLNCDLGEGEPIGRTRALMRHITSANVACGGHAGDVRSMAACVRLAKQFGVKAGAHPGLWSRADFGRGDASLTPDEFELLLLQQVSAVQAIAREAGLPLHHIKLHGALYHASETDSKLRRRYLECVLRFWPGARIYALAGGAVCRDARRVGVNVWPEVFADRAYRDDGTLVARGEPGAMIPSTRGAVEQVRQVMKTGELTTMSGARLKLVPRTVCVHSDSENAAQLLQRIASAVR